MDFTNNTVLVREKKRSRGQRTTRRVPLTPFLKAVLKDWLTIHPGGAALFCQAGMVARSKKRSRTTGHQSGKKRWTSLKGRMATVKKREQPAQAALTRNSALENQLDRLALLVWEQVPVSSPHLFGLVAHPLVDQSLVNPLGGTVRRKRVSQDVPTSQPCPLAALHRSLEMVVGLVAGQRHRLRAPRLAADYLKPVAEEELSSGVVSQPGSQYLTKELGQRHAAHRPLPLGSLLFM